MDQHKKDTPRGEQSETPRRETPGGDRSGQNWTQDHARGGESRDQARPQGTTRDQGPQQMPSGTERNEKGGGTQSERNRGGISNRGTDREMEEQKDLPDRGQRQSER
jgi:hypothetical protein